MRARWVLAFILLIVSCDREAVEGPPASAAAGGSAPDAAPGATGNAATLPSTLPSASFIWIDQRQHEIDLFRSTDSLQRRHVLARVNRRHDVALVDDLHPRRQGIDIDSNENASESQRRIRSPEGSKQLDPPAYAREKQVDTSPRL